jgi:hypothetical protein
MCFLNSDEQAYLEQNVHFFPLETLMGRQYSFQKLTQYSLGNNTLKVPASNVDGFLSRDTCVSLLS